MSGTQEYKFVATWTWLSGLAAQTERLDSLLAALDDHTGDVRLMKRQLRRAKSAVGVAIDHEDDDSSPLMSMIAGPIPSGLSSTT